MKITVFDRDEVLTSFLCDYLDNNLEKGEKASFEDYLNQNSKGKDFATKAAKGKRALEYFREQLSAYAEV